ncbi:MAG: hypothetical protein KGL59_11830 [Acidobacteriota bacterium]|nr:hypothetical protein [Acidobacteriota bacterium]
MTTEESGRANPNETISRKAYVFVALWASGVLLFYTVIGILGVNRLNRYKTQTHEMRNAWFASEMMGSSAATPVPDSPLAATPVAVTVLVNRIGDFSLREGRWDTDFDISFRWLGDQIDPGATFRVVNGEVLSRQKEFSETVDGERYERYNVRARIEQAFDPARFPFSDAALLVAIEDVSHDASVMSYQVSRSGIKIGNRAIGTGLKITKSYTGTKLYNYGPMDRPPSASGEVYSRFLFALFVEPRGREIYAKMFQALFASVAIALVIFFIKPTFVDPRFGLGVGAFFAAIGNNIFVVTLLPPAGRVTLTDMVNLIGLVTIFLTLVQSTISLHFCDTDRWRLSRFFDRLCFPVFLLGYAVVNFLLPFVSKS